MFQTNLKYHLQAEFLQEGLRLLAMISTFQQLINFQLLCNQSTLFSLISIVSVNSIVFFSLYIAITIDKAKAAIQKIAKEQGFDYVNDSTEGGSLILADGKDLMADVKVELGF